MERIEDKLLATFVEGKGEKEFLFNAAHIWVNAEMEQLFGL